MAIFYVFSLFFRIPASFYLRPGAINLAIQVVDIPRVKAGIIEKRSITRDKLTRLKTTESVSAFTWSWILLFFLSPFEQRNYGIMYHQHNQEKQDPLDDQPGKIKYNVRFISKRTLWRF